MNGMVVLLVLSCIVTAVVGSRKSWVPQQCKACRRYCAGQAKKCCHCLEWLALVLVICLWPFESRAQDLVLIPCPSINFFGSACEDAPESQRMLNAPVVLSPLFSKDTMAPDTPPLVIELLNHPTSEAAQRFLEWQARRFQAMDQAQKLLQQVTATRQLSPPQQ